MERSGRSIFPSPHFRCVCPPLIGEKIIRNLFLGVCYLVRYTVLVHGDLHTWSYSLQHCSIPREVMCARVSRFIFFPRDDRSSYTMRVSRPNSYDKSSSDDINP